MPTRRLLAPAVGLSAVALAVGTSTAAFAAAPAHAVSTTHHVHARGDVMHHSSGTAAAHLTPVSSAHHHGKVVLHDTSDNWAGYAASGGNFTSVAASWVQPAVTCGSQDTYSSFWVGIDGDGTSSVEQTGTEADCSGGSPSYSSWYEMYPAAPVNFNDTVTPGDSFTASVSSDGSGNFTLTLTDNTAGWTETQNQASTSAQDGSAEVIAEAPYSNGVLPLSNFGTVNFTGATANGTAIGSSSPHQINLVSNGGVTEATTSGLDSSGENFSVTWNSTGS